MKKLLLSIVAALLIFSGCNKSNQFKVKLNLDNSDGQTAYLIKTLDGKKPIVMDTIVFADNKAEVTLDYDDPQAMYILFFKETRENMTLFPENPVVKAAYEKYHAKGFEVIGISVDRNEAKWLEAVEEDALPYIQVRDVEGNVSDDYAIVSIPSNFLYDQNGIMVAKGLRGEELETKLAELLK